MGTWEVAVAWSRLSCFSDGEITSPALSRSRSWPKASASTGPSFTFRAPSSAPEEAGAGQRELEVWWRESAWAWVETKEGQRGHRCMERLWGRERADVAARERSEWCLVKWEVQFLSVRGEAILVRHTGQLSEASASAIGACVWASWTVVGPLRAGDSAWLEATAAGHALALAGVLLAGGAEGDTTAISCSISKRLWGEEGQTPQCW